MEMKINSKYNIPIMMSIIILAFLIMSYIDAILRPGYIVKSFIKIVLFLFIPLFYSKYIFSVDIKKMFKMDLSYIKKSFFFGIFIYILILYSYFLFDNIFVFSNVTSGIYDSVKVDKNNFIFVAIYISLINSLLEEFFFRGFCFISLKKFCKIKTAYVFSAISFALYHISIMIGWFSLREIFVSVLFLFIGGLIFDYIDEKISTIFASWIIHIFSNLAINTVGLILYKII